MPALIVLLLGIGTLVACAAYRRYMLRDERSVATYHTALEHLQQVSGSSPGTGGPGPQRCRPASQAHVRVLPGAQPRFQQLSLSTGSGAASHVSRRSSGWGTPPAERPLVMPLPQPPRVALPPAGRKLVFIDDSVGRSAAGAAVADEAADASAVTEPAEVAASAGATAETRVQRLPVAAGPGQKRRWASATLAPRVVRTAAVALVSAVVAVVVTLAASTPGRGHLVLPKSPASKAAIGATNPESSGSPASTPAAASAPVAPPRLMPDAAQTSPYSAAYQVGSGPLDLNLVAIGRCWVELRSGSSTGPISFEGLLTGGSTRAFQGLPGMWLEIGNPPGLDVLVDGSAVPLPAVARPYVITVQTSAPSPT